MDLFPSVIFRDDTSQGERRARALLQKAPGSEGAFAIHSLNLPEHEYKRYSEADFVVVDSRGVLVLEVKGGIVKCENGQWQFENGRGQARTKSEGPHQQAESAIHAVRKMLKSGGARYQPSVFGWAVVFPFTKWKDDHPEVPGEVVIDEADCADGISFTAAIDRAFAYWRERATESGRTIYPVDVEDYRNTLLPSFQYAPAPARCAEAILADVVRLSKHQCEIVEGFDSNQRLLIEAGAGTGKTVLAHAAAKKFAREGLRTGFIIGAPLLAAQLATELPDVNVLSSEELAGIPDNAFEVLVIDEGQELVNARGLGAIDRILENGLENGRWKWFMDADNQSMKNEVDPDCRARLRSLAFYWSPPHNVRSTREIVSLVKEALGADVGISEIDGRGIRPWVHVLENDDEALRWAVDFVAQKTLDGVAPKDIVVLAAPSSFDRVFCAMKWLPESELVVVRGPQQLDEMKSRAVISDPMTFRGLERAWTVVFCDEAFTRLKNGESYLYVAMTRSNAGLAIALGPKGRDWLYAFYERQAGK